MASIIQIRRDLAANWTGVNPILADGEFGYEKDTGKLKIGDGSTDWNTLPYRSTPSSLPWGSITGTLSDQIDLQATLDAKLDDIFPGTNISIDKTDPNNPIINALTAGSSGKYLISGGAIWSGTGLVYDVSTLYYYFNGNKSSAPASVTLAASDPTDNRLDAIVVDETGTVSVIAGTPSSSPITPAIPDDQLLIQYILVEAASTTPTVSQESIYLDNAEWTTANYIVTGSPTGTTNFDATDSPKQGSKCIDNNLDKRKGDRFVRSSSFGLGTFSILSMWVRFSAVVAANKTFQVRFEDATGTLIGNTIDLFNFGISRSITTTWQLAIVPVSVFGGLTTVQGLRVLLAGGTNGVLVEWDLDQILLTDGTTPVVASPTIAFYKDSTKIADQKGIDIIEGTGMSITAVEDAVAGTVKYTLNSTATGGPADTDDLTEGSTNFYFTVARVLATLLTGLSTVTGGNIISTDTVLAAFGKIQKRFNDLLTTFNGANQLVQMDGSGKLPAIDGSQLTNLPGGAVKASATELNTGTDDAKFATALGLENSKYLNQSGAKISATASGTDTYTATISPAITAYSSSQRFYIKFTNANTGAATLNLNTLGAKSIVKNGSTALSSGDISAGSIVVVAYDGTNFQIVGKIGGAGGASDNYATASGTNTYVATIAGVAAYSEGMSIRIKFTNANTGASTINVNSLGAKNIYKGAATALVSAVIAAGQVFELYYDGTVFQIGSVQVVPTAANKVITTDGTGKLQAVNDLIDVISTTSEATLVAADWSLDYATVTGTPGTKVYGLSSNYLYECSGVNTWWRTPLVKWGELYLSDVADGSGVKSQSDMVAAYPSAVQGNRVRGVNGVYEYLANTWGWVYFPFTAI